MGDERCVGKGLQPRPNLESRVGLVLRVIILQKNKRFVSIVVINAYLVHLLGHWFNSHLLHF